MACGDLQEFLAAGAKLNRKTENKFGNPNDFNLLQPGLIELTICYISSGPRTTADKFEEATQTARVSLIMIEHCTITDPVCDQNTNI